MRSCFALSRVRAHDGPCPFAAISRAFRQACSLCAPLPVTATLALACRGPWCRSVLPRSRLRLRPLHAQFAEGHSDYDATLPTGGSEGVDSHQPAGRLGVLVSASGLIATFWTSVSALSMTGMLATIAASAAGLFTFKLAKELHMRGVDSSIMSQAVNDT